MKQNLFNPKTTQQLCNRLDMLTPGYKNYLETMNPIYTQEQPFC